MNICLVHFHIGWNSFINRFIIFYWIEMKLHKYDLYYDILTADYCYDWKTTILHSLKITSRAEFDPTSSWYETMTHAELQNGCHVSIGNARNEFLGTENVGIDTQITNLCCLEADIRHIVCSKSAILFSPIWGLSTNPILVDFFSVVQYT